MRNSNALMILANNMFFLDTMLANMPEQTSSDLIIVNEIRCGNKMPEIKELLKKHKIRAIVLDSKEITEACAHSLKLSELGKSYIKSYTMGMNILAQYHVMVNMHYDKVLYLDDDVLINGDLAIIFEKERFAFLTYFLSAGVKHEHDRRHMHWRDFAQCSFKDWLSNYLNSGQRLYTSHIKFIKRYEYMLEQFFNDEEFFILWRTWKETGKGKTYAFFQDQNFETSVALNFEITNNNMKEWAMLILSIKNPYKDLKRYRSKLITHYACGQYKEAFLKMLKEAKVIV